MSIGTRARKSAMAVRAEFATVVGAATAALFAIFGPSWLADLGDLPRLAVIFLWIFGVMIWCAFGVVRHAEALAEILGEPLGTLILTISVISIEVTLLATVMLTGDPDPTLPRDTMYAILMIVLNGMVGLSLTIGAFRHGQQHYNLQGTVAFLAVISPLAIIALVIPEFITSTVNPRFTPIQATVFGLLTALLYGAFLVIQTKRHRSFFTEPEEAPIRGHVAAEPAPHSAEGRRSITFHAVLLVMTLVPVVLLSKPLASLLDYGITQLNLPTALGAILIAVLILSPEGTAAIQAAARNHLQRAVNLSLGSALSTIGLTVPVVIMISVVTGTPLDLGLVHVDIVLLALTLFLCQMTFSGVPTNILLGLVHLLLFFAYLVLALYP